MGYGLVLGAVVTLVAAIRFRSRGLIARPADGDTSSRPLLLSCGGGSLSQFGVQLEQLLEALLAGGHAADLGLLGVR